MYKTIYIIDDDALVRFIVEKMMSKVDDTLTFIHCENGKVGLEKLFEHKGDFSKCIVILDLNMPVLDGWGGFKRNTINTVDRLQICGLIYSIIIDR